MKTIKSLAFAVCCFGLFGCNNSRNERDILSAQFFMGCPGDAQQGVCRSHEGSLVNFCKDKKHGNAVGPYISYKKDGGVKIGTIGKQEVAIDRDGNIKVEKAATSLCDK